jgi:alcohol dehydrogenase class IV
MSFSFHSTHALQIGIGKSAQIGSIARHLLGSAVLVVTDRGIVELGLHQKALASLSAAGITVTVFAEVEADPSIATLEKSIETARACNASSVVGFGGGSSMDVAKLTALIVGSSEPIDEAWGVGNAKGPRLPLVLVPTTAGTGSEVTPVSIITCEGDEKRGVSSPLILPDMAILDAGLTLGLPRHVTAATGIDAMVHAIEAYTSKSPNNNLMSRMLAGEALRLLGSHIEAVCKDGSNAVARENMLIGATLAGMAFANSPVAAVHALAYPIGGMFHVPHGLSNALVLKEVMRFNAPVCHQAYSELAPIIFPDIDQGLSSQTTSAVLIERMGELSARVGLQTGLRQVGISKDDLPVMAAAAMKQTRLLVNNPREVSEADALAIYKAAW